MKHPHGLTPGDFVVVLNNAFYHNYEEGELCVYLEPSHSRDYPEDFPEDLLTFVLATTKTRINYRTQNIYATDFRPTKPPSINRDAAALLNSKYN